MSRRKHPNLSGCPRCGSPLILRAGLTVCSKEGCGYCADNSVSWPHRLASPKVREHARQLVSHPYLESWPSRELKL